MGGGSMATSEKQRVAAARARLSERRPDDLSDLVSAAALALRAPMAALGVADGGDIVYEATHGMSPRVLPRDSTFCRHTLGATDTFAVRDAALDARFAQLPQVEGSPHIRSYAGVPVLDASGRAVA